MVRSCGVSKSWCLIEKLIEDDFERRNRDSNRINNLPVNTKFDIRNRCLAKKQSSRLGESLPNESLSHR